MAYSAHPRAKVMSSTTAAADGDVSRFYLPGQLYTMFSGIGIYYPNGDETQRSGIKIDIPVSPTIKSIRAEKDELLDHAIQYLLQADWFQSGHEVYLNNFMIRGSIRSLKK